VKSKKPAILFLDIETAPSLGWVWGKWQQDVVSFASRWYLLSFSAKWQGGRLTTLALPDFPKYTPGSENDLPLVKRAWDLLNEADIVVAHNGDDFDVRKLQARFTFWNLPPPSPFRTVDTKKVAKKYFNFESNSLNDIAQQMGFGEKAETGGFKLWEDCMKGSPAAWKRMKKYNARDVVLLEKVYNRFLPWMGSHPSWGAFKSGVVCPKCGSTDLQSRGTYLTNVSRFRRWQCQACGGWARGRVHEGDRPKIVGV